MMAPKILQQTFRNENAIRNRSLPIKMIIFNWTLMGLLLLLHINTSEAVKYKGDSCESKSQPGICKGWSECPVIKTLIDRGEYTNLEVVTCGFAIREELICCPVIKAATTLEGDDMNRSVILTTTTTTTTTTPVTERDFWLDILENINKTSAATTVPEFWHDLLTTTTTTTTTTTMRPLMVGNQRLNQSSEFFDLNVLLSGTQKRQTNTELNANEPNNQQQTNNDNIGVMQPGRKNNENHNNRGANLNSGLVNTNQWTFEQSSNNQRGNNGRGHQNNGRGQQNNIRGIGGNNGRGQQNNIWGIGGNNGRGQQNNIRGFGGNNGRGQQNNNRGFGGNNGRSQQNRGQQNKANASNNPDQYRNPNMAIKYPENNNNPFTFPHSPNSPVNNMKNQNSNMTSTNTDDDQYLDNLLKDVFDTSSGNFRNSLEQNKTSEPNLDTLLTNIFDLPETQSTQNIQSSQGQNVNNPQPQIVPNNQVNYINPYEQNAPIGPFHKFHDAEPATNFIRQPVVVETWPHHSAHTPEFDPIQNVYHNLIDSGMDIIRVEADQVQNSWQQQQQQYDQFVHQSNQNHFVQQQSPTSQQWPTQFVQQLAQTPKGIRSVPQPSVGNSPNIQSPPINILDPFKPFEFRPPPVEEVNNSLSPNQKPTVNPTTDRPAVRACRRIEKGLNASLTIHILGGTPVSLGEIPHMVGIGYSRIGGDDVPPYDIRCGGALIDTRFVLTAAHCVADRLSVPSIVRLGVVNNTDGDHMKDAVEIRIKNTFIHDDYATSSTYNDIAVLELERAVIPNDIVFPVCLHSDTQDPDTTTKLWVSGWGTFNVSTRSFSDILLKAPLYTAPLESCNQSYVNYGLNRRIVEGVRRTQICALYDGEVKDTCQGDSGGPLQLVVDESLKQYRLIGVVSAGFSCGTPTPSLYTRVAAFLDFIEKIVWPNGGD